MNETTTEYRLGTEDIIECERCGARMRDSDRTREEMRLHEDECDGISDPRERFEDGDRVEYSDFGLKRLGREQRGGEVVGFSRKHDHCVRVRFDGNKTPNRLAHRFVTHTGT